MTNRKNVFGFTIVELMVGMGIIMLMISTGITSMSKFAARDRILATKNEIVSGIKMARNYAMTMQKPAGYAPQLDSVAFTIDSNGIFTIYPITTTVGIGPSYYSKKVASDNVSVTQINITPLGLKMVWGYSVPEGKLVGYRLYLPQEPSYPMSSTSVFSIGISATDVSVGETRSIVIYPGGTFDEK